MPDKYGFSTDDERHDADLRRRESSGQTAEHRIRRFHDLDPKVEDILQHFGDAIRPSGTLDVYSDAEGARWSVRPVSEAGMVPSLLDLNLLATSDGREFLGIWDFGVEDPTNLSTLVEVLGKETNLEVRRLGEVRRGG